ncbi:MAG TPA: YbaY family lipoprotein [Gammaproteobacteria bacterium]|nr:YbaY family lipoprotein [Gammaproteobacteria bacterium]
MNNMLLRIGLSSFLLLFAAANAQGGGTPSAAADSGSMVTGTLNYRERILLPPDALVLVQLRDVSLMDVGAKLISEQRIKPEHPVPIPFALPYDANDIDERMTYSVFATIRSGDRLLFVTDRSYQVLTRGNSDHVELILVQP